jgi:hypothetical protein
MRSASPLMALSAPKPHRSSLADAEWLLTRCFLRRSRYYADIIKANSSQGKYLNGWFNRLDELANACQEVIGGQVSVPRS